MAEITDLQACYENFLAEDANDYFHKKLYANNSLCSCELLYKFAITNLIHMNIEDSTTLEDDVTEQILEYGETVNCCG